MPKYTNIDEIDNKIKAVKEFTDREEPRKVFWNHYYKLADSLRKNENHIPISVLTYYGYGGIGKTALLQQLFEELEKQHPETKVEFLDFEKISELNNNTLEVLKVIRYDLKQKYNFSFPIFDLVVYVYESKLGKDVSKPELKSIFDENKELGFLKDVISEIPLIGPFAKVIEFAFEGKNILQERLNKNKLNEQLLELENQGIEEIKSMLQYYFALDLAENIKQTQTPFVFFIDTYEKLVNVLSASGNPIDNDLWIRGEKGLILNIPNTLWVIGGREKLRWEEEDKEWTDSLEQHLMKVLSFADTKNFFEVAGITNENLIHELYDLTRGYPKYLDMCVDVYTSLLENGKEPKISDFGADTTELEKRLFIYMNDAEKDFSIMLAYVPSWTDDTIENISKNMLGNFSYSLYRKVKNLSFIIAENGTYRMDQSVKDVLIANTPKDIKQRFLKKVENQTDEKIEYIIKKEEENIQKIEKIENKPISKINKYEPQNSYEKVILGIMNELCKAKDLESFKQQSNFLLKKIEDYESKFNNPIDINKIYEGFFEQISSFSDTAEFIKLSGYTKLNIKDLLKKSNLLKMYQDNKTYLLNRYLRYSNETILNLVEFEELTTLYDNDEDNLYYIKLLGFVPTNYPDYDKIIEKRDNLLRNYKGEKTSFYVELLINTCSSNDTKAHSEAVNKEEKETYSSMDSILERFNSLMAEVDDITGEIEKDANMDMDYILGKTDKNTKLDQLNETKADKISRIIDVLQENPKLLTTKILNDIFHLDWHDFGELGQKKLFDYMYSIKYIPVYSSDVKIIDEFYKIFKEYLGGEYNIRQPDNSDDEMLIQKAMYALDMIKDRYIELYGEDSYVVVEAETYLLKFKLKEDPSIIEKIMDKNISKLGIANYKTEKNFVTLMSEIDNLLQEYRFNPKITDYWFNDIYKYGMNTLNNLSKKVFEVDDVNIHSHLVNVLYNILEKLYDLEENEMLKQQKTRKMYDMCFKINTFYDEKYMKISGNDLMALFKFSERCLDEYSENHKKLYLLESINKVFSTMVKNKYLNPELETLAFKCIIYKFAKSYEFMENNCREYVTNEYKIEYDNNSKTLLKKTYRNYEIENSKDNSRIFAYTSLLIMTFLKDIIKHVNKLNEYYYNAQNYKNGIIQKMDKINANIVEDYFDLIHYNDVLCNKRCKQVQDIDYDVLMYYTNMLCLIIGKPILYNMDEIIEKRTKKIFFKPKNYNVEDLKVYKQYYEYLALLRAKNSPQGQIFIENAKDFYQQYYTEYIDFYK